MTTSEQLLELVRLVREAPARNGGGNSVSVTFGRGYAEAFLPECWALETVEYQNVSELIAFIRAAVREQYDFEYQPAKESKPSPVVEAHRHISRTDRRFEAAKAVAAALYSDHRSSYYCNPRLAAGEAVCAADTLLAELARTEKPDAATEEHKPEEIHD